LFSLICSEQQSVRRRKNAVSGKNVFFLLSDIKIVALGLGIGLVVMGYYLLEVDGGKH
jgi:hypothetical protein